MAVPKTLARCRQSNRSHSKLLLQKLEAISEANGGARVNIVSHSMGGLVTKLLLAQYPQAFERLVRLRAQPCPSVIRGCGLLAAWQ